VVPAQDLNEARRALAEFKPVAIVLDVLLQGEHSWQLLQDLKENPSTRDIPVFVVTVVENESKALALGATAFHAKPIDRAWLVNQLQAVLGRNQGQILIADDDEISRYLLRGLLANTGYRLLEARGGNEAVKLAAENKPNLIILDLSMPDLNGFEVMNILKNDAGTREIPIVIYTSQALDSAERERLQSAVDIVPKEMKSRELMETRFTEALARAGLHASIQASETAQP
jgi:CheY-like chemotaxis protein